MNRSLTILTKIYHILFRNNPILPLDPAYQSWGQRFILLAVPFALVLLMLLSVQPGDLQRDIHQNPLLQERQTGQVAEATKDIHFWVSVNKHEVLRNSLQFDDSERIPEPHYPIFAHIQRNVQGYMRSPVANFKEIIHFLRHRGGNGLTIKDINLNILREDPNSKEFAEAEEIPEDLKLAFVHAEDQHFYMNPGGINPIRLASAAFYYALFDSNKGNSSIAEQVYKFYFGKDSNDPRDKLYQILGAMYLTYFSENRDDILNLYVQSVPGSFWGGHTYGVKSIAKLYLGEEDLSVLGPVEWAWLSRIGLRPGEHGSEFANYTLVSRALAEKDVDLNQLGVRYARIGASEEYRAVDFDFSGRGAGAMQDQLEALIEDEEQILWFSRMKHKENDPELMSPREIYRWLVGLRSSRLETTRRLKLVLEDFRQGAFSAPKLLNDDAALDDAVDVLRSATPLAFQVPRLTNIHQTYTDQTKVDLRRVLGEWAESAGLVVVTAFDEELQTLLDKELEDSAAEAQRYRSGVRREIGGASVLMKTHRLQNYELENKIVALASHHPFADSSFNWAVDGQRMFGSIYKWMILLQYLEEGGTLADEYYDIPREFRNPGEAPYRPDNYPYPSDNYHGFFTFNREDMAQNFIKSKNVTFVHIMDMLGRENVARFLNRVSEYDRTKQRESQFQPLLSTALGAHDTSPVVFAQMLSVVANRGKYRPATTIEYILSPSGEQHDLAKLLPEQQLVSREAAEAAFWAGYLNPYDGTAKQFRFRGGVSKTGSSKRDAAFVTMTARLPHQRIEDNENHLLNSNLLYLVVLGVDKGEVYTNLFGGNVPARNARSVFEYILEYNPATKETAYEIAAEPEDILESFSPNFERKDRYVRNLGSTYLPIPRHHDVAMERGRGSSELSRIATEYITRKILEYEMEHGEPPPPIYDDEGVVEISTAERLADVGSYEVMERVQQEYCEELELDEFECDQLLYGTPGTGYASESHDYYQEPPTADQYLSTPWGYSDYASQDLYGGSQSGSETETQPQERAFVDQFDEERERERRRRARQAELDAAQAERDAENRLWNEMVGLGEDWEPTNPSPTADPNDPVARYWDNSPDSDAQSIREVPQQ